MNGKWSAALFLSTPIKHWIVYLFPIRVKWNVNIPLTIKSTDDLTSPVLSPGGALPGLLIDYP